jgi:lysophospholipase L1-like esterase
MTDYSQYVTIPSASHCASLFTAGQSGGLRAGVFAKIGDSISYWQYFLGPLGFSRTPTVWGDHANLAPTVTYFSATTARIANSFADRSVATLRGGTSADLLALLSNYTASVRYDNGGALCSGKTPIACTCDDLTPAYALVMIGTNDLPGGNASGFQANLQTIVNTLTGRNIIPVLSTLPPRLDGSYNVAGFNAAISAVSSGSNIPLIDLNAALTALGAGNNYGIGVDNVHPSWSANGNTADFTNAGLLYGYNVRNICTLEALRLVRSAAGG